MSQAVRMSESFKTILINTRVESSTRSKITIPTIHQLYKEGKPVTMLTAYDFPTGRLCENTSVDITLVGDSLAQVCLGYDSTVRLTLDEMIHHCRAVGRGSKSPLLVADMPFGTYFNPEDAIRNAARLMQEGGVESVKLEGGREVIETIKKLTHYGIPVMGHIGLMPQRHASIGGYHMQGQTSRSASAMLDTALHLQGAGVFAIVIEAVPGVVGTSIAEKVQKIPVIGIGAGRAVDGQVLVVSDALGISPKSPRFARRFAEISETAEAAVELYAAAVRSREFPKPEEVYLMRREQVRAFRAKIGHSKYHLTPSADELPTEESAESHCAETPVVEEPAVNHVIEDTASDKDPMVELKAYLASRH